METDEGSRRVLPFQLQFDKPLASQVKMAEWNSEKDLLAMVTEDSKVGASSLQLAEVVDNLSCKNEFHQIARQFSDIEDLLNVVWTSLSVMHKQWADAMNIFHEKFDLL
ncbi:anaphase-promoting complex subunit 4-like [Eucalyptus grandis]|uniref:anaphase-promoting complex subunit 4-like n=1 Tax=Eucalyptus grandis TaxID=71139 RepID=UPI00192E8550|nr:anaphase-promoting complex subunit 4-like [Eucalyptus grandis]